MINDKGEVILDLAGLDRLDTVKLKYPATIEHVQKTLKTGVQNAIKQVAGYKLTKQEKQDIIYIASGFRLVRPF